MSLTALESRTVPNYRARLAFALPAIQLAYFVLIWPLVFGRGLATADLTTGPMPETQSFLINRLFFPAIAGIAILILIAERHRLSGFRPSGLVLFTALFAWFALATGWALAPSTSLSKLALLILQTLGLVPAVLLARRADDVLRPMFWVMALTFLANLAAVAVLPTTPIGHPGIYAHKNTLGASAALAGMFALYGLTRGNERVRATGALMLPLTLVLLYLSQSKTATGLFLASPLIALAALILWRAFRVAPPVLIMVLGLPAAALLGGAFEGFSYRDISTAVSGDATFTGRTELWDFALAYIAERPWRGYGYQSFWGIGEASPAASLPEGFLQRTPHAHNGYLDVTLQGGLIALILFLALLMTVARWAGRLADRDAGLGYFILLLLIYLILMNLLETDWLQGLSGTSMLTMLLILMASVSRNGRALT